jgi:predicted transcriptional regulator YdeE
MAILNKGVISFPEKTICGIAVDIYSIMMADQYDPQAIPGAWQEFWKNFPKGSLPKGSEAYGVSFPITAEPGKLHYVAGVEVSKDFVAPTGFEICTIPSGNYLYLEHQGKISELAQSYGIAYGVEFPKAEVEMRPAPHLELYDATLNPMSDDYVMGILIPVN